ncbi:formin-like protein 16 [Triticum aestivum]|uniref:formin-like protein 16 n=1 Tax=Triticum aestivum TaxID=4565 RepID=UPI001D01A72C|nr:formin-like protein 16 [Triticum aestivum]
MATTSDDESAHLPALFHACLTMDAMAEQQPVPQSMLGFGQAHEEHDTAYIATVRNSPVHPQFESTAHPAPARSTFLLFPPPRHAISRKDKAPAAATASAPAIKPRPLAGPLLLLLLLLLRAAPLACSPRPARSAPPPPPLRPGGASLLRPPRRAPAGPLLLHPSSGPCVGYRQMSHLLFLVLLRTLMGGVCLQHRTDNSDSMPRTAQGSYHFLFYQLRFIL